MSGPRFLLDTNVVIGLVNGPGAARNLVDLNEAPPDVCAVSQISGIELLSFPALSADEEARINVLLTAVTVIVLDDRIERETIALRRRIRMKLPDAVIAATARVHGLKLLTLDERLEAAFNGA